MQQKLARAVLYKQFKSWEFFFEDFNGKTKAPEAFMIDVVTRLSSQMHDPGATIVPRGQTMNDLHLVAQGNCELYGYFKDEMS